MLPWGFVQAGGRSSRMGSDKAWMEIAGQPMIQRVLDAMRSVVKQTGIVINQANPMLARYEELSASYEAQLLFDLHDHRGPLGGIATALHVCAPQTSALIVACDLPFASSALFTLLSQIHQREHCELTLPSDVEGRAQPLAAVYSSRCLPAVEDLLQRDVRRVDRLFELVRTRHVAFAEYHHLPDAARLLLNLNRPEDLTDAGVAPNRQW